MNLPYRVDILGADGESPRLTVTVWRHTGLHVIRGRWRSWIECRHFDEDWQCRSGKVSCHSPCLALLLANSQPVNPTFSPRFTIVHYGPAGLYKAYCGRYSPYKRVRSTTNRQYILRKQPPSPQTLRWSENENRRRGGGAKAWWWLDSAWLYVGTASPLWLCIPPPSGLSQSAGCRILSNTRAWSPDVGGLCLPPPPWPRCHGATCDWCLNLVLLVSIMIGCHITQQVSSQAHSLMTAY